MEHRASLIVEHYEFAVDGAIRQGFKRLANFRKRVQEIRAATAHHADVAALSADGQSPEAIMIQLEDPALPSERLRGRAQLREVPMRYHSEQPIRLSCKTIHG